MTATLIPWRHGSVSLHMMTRSKRAERNIAVLNIVALARALRIKPAKLLDTLF